MDQRYLGGGPSILWSMCCSIVPKKSRFIALLRRNFGVCCSMGPNCLEKSTKNSIHFRNFFQKSMFYASKCFQMVRLWKIVMISPIKLHTGCFSKIFENFEYFRKFRKLSKIWPQNPPKITFYCSFNKEFLAECVLKVKKADFVLLGPPARGSVPPNTSDKDNHLFKASLFIYLLCTL